MNIFDYTTMVPGLVLMPNSMSLCEQEGYICLQFCVEFRYIRPNVVGQLILFANCSKASAG